MEQQIREINKVPVPPLPPHPKPLPPPPRGEFQNPKRQKHFDDSRNSAQISVAGWSLTDDDMTIVANVLRTNTVRSHYFLLNIYIPLIP